MRREKMCCSLEIEDLSWKYLRMYPLRDIIWENFHKILAPMDYDESQVFQQQVLHSTVKHPIAQKYPPAKAYMQLFLKALINQVEGCNQEVHDDLYCIYTGLLSQESFQSSDFCYKTYKQKSGSITLKETCNIICNGTTGMCTWQKIVYELKEPMTSDSADMMKLEIEVTDNLQFPSSSNALANSSSINSAVSWMSINENIWSYITNYSEPTVYASHFLAEWCSKNASHFQGKNVLELGSGLGLTGLAVVKNCKPSSYTFTDVHDSVLKVLVENVNINLSYEASQSAIEHDTDNLKSIGSWSRDFQSRYHNTMVQIKKLDWECDTYDSDVDIILAADVVYDPDVIAHFIKVLKEVICRKSGIIAYVASTMRNPDTYAFFRDELACKGLVATSEVQQQNQDSPSQPEVSLSLLHIQARV